MTALGFERLLAERATAVERALERLLPATSGPAATVHQSMRYSTLGGGKRLRGVMAMEAAKFGPDRLGPVDSAAGDGLASAVASVGAPATLASALEMIHAYSLVHDDLPCMDDDDFRRGRPSNHKVFGEGVAVLAGDALLTRAFELLVALPWAGIPAERALRIAAEIAQAAGTEGLIGGQVADLEAEQRASEEGGWRREDAEEALAFIHRAKTGALFRASLRSGAILAGAGEDDLRRITAYAEGVGYAFQIVDDVLDVIGDAQALGKATGRDLKKGKLTFASLYGVERALEIAAGEVERAKEALSGYGEEAGFLLALADYIVARDR